MVWAHSWLFMQSQKGWAFLSITSNSNHAKGGEWWTWPPLARTDVPPMLVFSCCPYKSPQTHLAYRSTDYTLRFWRSEVWHRFLWAKIKQLAGLVPSGGSRVELFPYVLKHSPPLSCSPPQLSVFNPFLDFYSHVPLDPLTTAGGGSTG
jgi:hypothetical protein